MEIMKNNSSEMKTVVETFIIEETAELIYDNEQLEKWNQQVEELGLVGQKKIVKPEKSPIPFMHMKATTRAIFETLCPRKVSIENYDITPIPVEILDLVMLAKREGYFDKIQIWYDDKSPDPVCVGLVYDSEEHRKSGYDWYLVPYLMGKWSDVKQSFEELKERAVNRFKQQKIAELSQIIRDKKRELEDIDSTIMNQFGADNSLPF